MKRDIDLIKAILLGLEESDSVGEVPGYSGEQIGYHIALLEDAGLITRELHHNAAISAAMLARTRMTWAGHEFLDASRNKSIWEKAKKITLEKTGALTFEVLKSVLIQLGKEAVSGIAS
jgi:hypothetical protein